ncbi:MAG: pentapeptide repeat-containing protein [Bacteroidetes bacterium]|nr:pentapeptide repeat-containing protein [Bacteroidota bacterium]
MPDQTEILAAIKQGELAWIDFFLKEKDNDPTVRFEVRDCDLSGYSFNGWLFGGISFDRVSFEKTNFSNARFIDCFISRSSFKSANFEGANLSYYNEDIEGTKKEIRNFNAFAECDFSDANLRYSDLRGCVLNASNLQGADLSYANMSETLLAWANGIAVKIHKANLHGVVLSKFSGGQGGIGRFADLALAEGLEEAQFENEEILKNYLSEVFSVIHENELTTYAPNETYAGILLDRIKALHLLYEKVDVPKILIDDLSILQQAILIDIQRNPRNLRFLKGRLFEELVAELLSSYGWVVELTKKTRDGGYDIFAISKDISGLKSSWIIECKGWENKVGIDVVRALYGVKADLKVSNALLATTSEFSGDVLKYKASRYDLELKDYYGLLEWINTYKPKNDGKLYYQKG